MSATPHGGSRLRDPQATAKARAACVEYVRKHPNCKRADVCQGTGLSDGAVRHHLYWASLYGFVKAEGHSRGARWIALDIPSANETPIEDSRAFYTRTKDEAELDERRREILSYVRSHGPVPTREIHAAFSFTKSVIDQDLRFLREAGCIQPTTDGGPKAWEFLRMLPRPTDPKTQPVVGIKAQHRFCEPGPVITKVEQGVKYTIAAAPKGRFDVDIPPGGGVISRDNHRLAQALSRIA